MIAHDHGSAEKRVRYRRLGTPLMTVSLARSSGQIRLLWVVRIDAQLLGSPNCLSRSIAALTCVRKRLTADCTDGSAA